MFTFRQKREKLVDMIPLFHTDQIREADNYAISQLGIPGIVLMENASLNIFSSILDFVPNLNTGDKIGVLTGKGNNGGDGLAVARHFINNGFDVKIISMSDGAELKGDALTNFKITSNLIKRNNNSHITKYQKASDLNKLKDCIIIIDALLGTGAKGELKEPYQTIVEKVNDFNAVRVAVDIPTGLNADEGSGKTVFDADLTGSLGEYKRGLFFGKGYAKAGKVVKGSIGIGSEYFDSLEVGDYLIEPEDAFDGLPQKKIDMHKYSAGKVLTIAGSGSLPGAAVFTANSVIKGGAGASVLAFPKSIKSIAQEKLESPTLHAYEDLNNECLSKENIDDIQYRINWADVIAMGPGLGREEQTVSAIQEILKKYKYKKFVIDADGVFALGKEVYKKVDLKDKVLTPHHKEFADLLGITVEELENDLLGTGKNFVQETKSFLVLKGAPTMIFNPAGECFVNSTGNPGMAKFGVGDVLTGIIAAFMAHSDDIESAIISAVYIHSLAGDMLLKELTEYGISATDLMENIPYAIKFIKNSILQSTEE